jgi:hypothetical protein
MGQLAIGNWQLAGRGNPQSAFVRTAAGLVLLVPGAWCLVPHD